MTIGIYTTLIIVLVIVLWQRKFFKHSCNRIDELKNIFPASLDNLRVDLKSEYVGEYQEEYEGDDESNVEDEYEEYDEESVINYNSIASNYELKNGVFSGIIDTINEYLRENRGAASDFHLIKDVVDRNCESIEEEIASLAPLPIYCGLIGTMIGILVGVGLLVFSGDLGGTSTVDSVGITTDSIYELLGGVAVAMISSACGIIMTAISSSRFNSAKSTLNKNKNNFFSWIQTRLMPTLSGSAVSAIAKLEETLSGFNKNFAKAGDSYNEQYKEQRELLSSIAKLDVAKMAKANIDVLKELNFSVERFDKFNAHLNQVNAYVRSVNELSSKINEHLDRTDAIEKMGQFFKDEIENIETRKSIINSSVDRIDDALTTGLEKLKEASEKKIHDFANFLEDQNNQFKVASEDQRLILHEKLEEVSDLAEAVKSLKDIRNLSTLSKSVEAATIAQGEKLNSLEDYLKDIIVQNQSSGIGFGKLIFSIISGIIAAAAVILFIVSAIIF